MMREAMNSLGAHSESTVMVGDRMDTDIVAGIEAGLQTILVLSGVTSRSQIERFPYRPGPGGGVGGRPGRRPHRRRRTDLRGRGMLYVHQFHQVVGQAGRGLRVGLP